jgi:hypothetical protein
MSDLDIDLSPGVRISDPTPGLTLVGMTPSPGKIHNTGRGRIVLIGEDGSRVIIEPGETGEMALPSGGWRIACPDCGLHTGQHETWCPLWQPY